MSIQECAFWGNHNISAPIYFRGRTWCISALSNMTHDLPPNQNRIKMKMGPNSQFGFSLVLNYPHSQGIRQTRHNRAYWLQMRNILRPDDNFDLGLLSRDTPLGSWVGLNTKCELVRKSNWWRRNRHEYWRSLGVKCEQFCWGSVFEFQNCWPL